VFKNNKDRNPKMDKTPHCPKCTCEFTYFDSTLFVCSNCAYEWSEDLIDTNHGKITKDANGNILSDGDTVSVIKDLKVKGSSLVVKVGTKVKSIKLIEGDHDIDCKVKGIGPMKLKSQFVKKV
jgi:protein PhnA